MGQLQGFLLQRPDPINSFFVCVVLQALTASPTFHLQSHVAVRHPPCRPHLSCNPKPESSAPRPLSLSFITASTPIPPHNHHPGGMAGRVGGGGGGEQCGGGGGWGGNQGARSGTNALSLLVLLRIHELLVQPLPAGVRLTCNLAWCIHE